MRLSHSTCRLTGQQHVQRNRQHQYVQRNHHPLFPCSTSDKCEAFGTGSTVPSRSRMNMKSNQSRHEIHHVVIVPVHNSKRNWSIQMKSLCSVKKCCSSLLTVTLPCLKVSVLRDLYASRTKNCKALSLKHVIVISLYTTTVLWQKNKVAALRRSHEQQ